MVVCVVTITVVAMALIILPVMGSRQVTRPYRSKKMITGLGLGYLLGFIRVLIRGCSMPTL